MAIEKWSSESSMKTTDQIYAQCPDQCRPCLASSQDTEYQHSYVWHVATNTPPNPPTDASQMSEPKLCHADSIQVLTSMSYRVR